MQTITDENFIPEVLQSERPVLVDFWGETCPPCKLLMPIIQEISDIYEKKVKIVKANIVDVPEFAEQYKVMAVPTLLLFTKGIENKRQVGFLSKKEIIAFLSS